MIQNNSGTPWIFVFLVIAATACITFSTAGGIASSLTGGSFEGGFKKSATLGIPAGNPVWEAPQTGPLNFLFERPPDAPWNK